MTLGKSASQSKFEKDTAEGAAALDDSLKPLWSLFDKKLRVFESDIKDNCVKLKKLHVRMKIVEEKVFDKEIKIFKEFKDRQIREQNIILDNFSVSKKCSKHRYC